MVVVSDGRHNQQVAKDAEEGHSHFEKDEAHDLR